MPDFPHTSTTRLEKCTPLSFYVLYYITLHYITDITLHQSEIICPYISINTDHNETVSSKSRWC